MIDRRATPRYGAVEYRVWMGWWANSHDFRAIAAQLDNISLGGARLITPVPPAADQDIWMRLGTVPQSDCIRASVLDVTIREDGDYVVRLVFDDPCPQSFFYTVVTGDASDAFSSRILETAGV